MGGLQRRAIVSMVGFVAAATMLSACGISLPSLSGGPPSIGPRGVFSMGGAPVKGADARFAFEPISGAPVRVELAMSAELKRDAATRKLTIVPRDDASATYRVKGYLSAIADTSGAILIYVWDVTDPQGKRLRRFSGQERGRPAATEPWRGIDEETVKTAAQATIDALANWIGGS